MPTSSSSMPQRPQSQDSPQGIAAGLAAFGMWGLLTLYWKLLSGMPAYEQMSHRIVWSVLSVVPIIVLTGRMPMLRAIIRNRRLVVGLLCSTVFIGLNWYLYIWAISQNRVVEASLGYYINPLVSALLGCIVLKERFSRLQGIGVLLAALGVFWSFFGHSGPPWLALALALSFALYGLARKIVPVDPLCGVFVETLLLSPAAAIVLLFANTNGGGQDLALLPILMLAGPLTLLPMLAFNYAAQRIRLTVLGLTQYLSPTISFVLGVWLFQEPFDLRALITFGFIWAGLFVFTWASWRLLHAPRR